MKNDIDSSNVHEALEYYKANGFKYLNVDWVAPPEIVRITTHRNCRLHMLNDKSLVGSAEQSFLNMMINEKLSPGKYVTATPCFRDDVNDELHSTYFFKVELIDFNNVSAPALWKIIDCCKEFFASYMPVTVMQTDKDNWDIIDCKNGIELGSYGIRSYDRFTWIYATGLAEPRFSYVRSLQ